MLVIGRIRPLVKYREASAASTGRLWRMSRVCQVTGRRPAFGRTVSHANNKSQRRFMPNLQSKRFWVPEEGRWIRLKVSARAIKTISRHGITAVLHQVRARGEHV
jgi:large subunit ribosomal protein L28